MIIDGAPMRDVKNKEIQLRMIVLQCIDSLLIIFGDIPAIGDATDAENLIAWW